MKVPGEGISRARAGFEPSFLLRGRKMIRESGVFLSDHLTLEAALSVGLLAADEEDLFVLILRRPRKDPWAWIFRKRSRTRDKMIMAKIPCSILLVRLMVVPMMKNMTSNGLIFQNLYKVEGGVTTIDNQHAYMQWNQITLTIAYGMDNDCGKNRSRNEEESCSHGVHSYNDHQSSNDTTHRCSSSGFGINGSSRQ